VRDIGLPLVSVTAVELNPPDPLRPEADRPPMTTERNLQ